VSALISFAFAAMLWFVAPQLRKLE
jgi:hypothetical protein